MKQINFIALMLVFGACINNTEDYQKHQKSELITEGKRLVTVFGCNDCHSPKKMTKSGPVPDESRLLSGHPMNPKNSIVYPKLNSNEWILFNTSGTSAIGPWGTSFAANLTPDETGIGTWTLAQFTRAMREGKSKGLENGRPLLPPMPTIGYKKLTDNELKAMFRYLKSILPIENIVPAPILR
jgi:mono/diheme cytochrome c family protein